MAQQPRPRRSRMAVAVENRDEPFSIFVQQKVGDIRPDGDSKLGPVDAAMLMIAGYGDPGLFRFTLPNGVKFEVEVKVNDPNAQPDLDQFENMSESQIVDLRKRLHHLLLEKQGGKLVGDEV